MRSLRIRRLRRRASTHQRYSNPSSARNIVASSIPRYLHSKLSRVNSLLAILFNFGYHHTMKNQISKARLAQLALEIRREFASAGGNARAKKLTKKRRQEIASMGGKAGGRGRKKTRRRKAAV
jgi:hypothetical protein